MTLEEDVESYKALAAHIAELEKQKKELSGKILGQMTQKTMQISGYSIKKYERLTMKLSIDQARALGATKMEEVLDRPKIKELYLSGKEISGVSSWTGLMVCSSRQVDSVEEEPVV